MLTTTWLPRAYKVLLLGVAFFVSGPDEGAPDVRGSFASGIRCSNQGSSTDPFVFRGPQIRYFGFPAHRSGFHRMWNPGFAHADSGDSTRSLIHHREW